LERRARHLPFELILAIDLLNGKCVRLYQGDYDQAEVFNEDPVAMAQQWVNQGATRLHLVDLDGAKAGYPVNLEVISASFLFKKCDNHAN